MAEPTPCGFHDMNGNVSEWVNDWYFAYPSSKKRSLQDSNDPVEREVRGGGVNLQLIHLESAHRHLSNSG
ncbi:MAG: SUMF1/EgtB/PvdO family nonheme iron enzyme [Opitutales bacterium]|nr:SUMF1/EgtB/PvdO family nonheme iron enzyme [Opitutales bacterium]